MPRNIFFAPDDGMRQQTNKEPVLLQWQKCSKLKAKDHVCATIFESRETLPLGRRLKTFYPPLLEGQSTVQYIEEG